MLLTPDSRVIMPQNGLVGWWDFSLQSCYPGSGSNLNNLTNDTDLTIYGTPTFYSGSGYGRQCVDLNSSTKYLQATTSLTNLQPTGGVTMSFWMNAESYNPSYNGIAGLTLSGQARGYVFDTDVAGGLIYFRIGNGTWGTASVAKPSAGVWTHIVGTWDGSTVRIYKNATVSGTTASKASITYTGTGLAIGRYYNSSSFTYSGKISDVLIYNRALSADEITRIYNLTKEQFN